MSVGGEDVLLARLDSSGACVWSKSFGLAGQYQQLDSVAVDGAGNLLVSGETNSIDLGGGPLTGYFIAKFDSAGAYAWSKAFAVTCTESIGPQLVVDPQGNVIIGSCFEGSVDFGGGTLTTTGYAAFVAKFDTTGAYQWAKQYGDAAAVGAIATDACGNVFVTGAYGDTLDFGTGTLTANSSVENAFLAKMDPSGNGSVGQDVR